VAAVHTSANASLIAGYGYAGILVAFIARQQPLAVIPVAILFGGFGAAGSLLQRRLGLPDASVLLLQGIAFVLILASEALRDVDWKALRAKLAKNADPRPSSTVIAGLTGETPEVRSDQGAPVNAGPALRTFRGVAASSRPRNPAALAADLDPGSSPG
jgi:hypothetical protein